MIDGRFAIPGAQDPETILATLERARQRRALELVEPADPAVQCEGDSCAI